MFSQAIYNHLRHGAQIAQRHYALSFVVVPLVAESDALQAASAEAEAERLAAALPQLRIGLVHGQQRADERDATMTAFAAGQKDVLVATTIIEVGIDVPNASVVLIEDAERFGLAQLHQLRGRVGRGRTRGVAYLLTDPAGKLPRATRKRLETLETLDRLGAGFAISARDLDQRGAGEVFAVLVQCELGLFRPVGLELVQPDRMAVHFLLVGDGARGAGADLDQGFLHFEDDHADHLRRVVGLVEHICEVGRDDVTGAAENAHEGDSVVGISGG